ncbi:MAG: excinuclease ABC subunit UvrB [Promethearchaeota archaeon]
MSSEFKLESEFVPSGDQPEAIKALADGIQKGKRFQTLLGATGTGKSLDFNEWLIIRDKDKYIRKVKIGEFVEKNFKSPSILNDSFYESISGYNIISINNSNLKVEEKEIIEISKHKEAKLFEITLDDFSKIKVTKDHNLYKFNNCELELCTTENLKVGDYLPTSNDILSPVFEVHLANLLEFNEDAKLNIESIIRNNIKEIDTLKEAINTENKAYNGKINQILASNKERGIKKETLDILLDKLNKDLTELNEDIFFITKGEDNLHPLIPIDENFLTFSGLYLSKGHSTKNYILISNSELALQKKCKEFFDNLKLNYIQRNDNDIQFNSVILTNFFSNLGTNAYSKRISSLYYNLSNDDLAVFLRALFDGDGWVEKSAICYLSASLELANDIKNLLLRFKITSRINKKNKGYRASDGQIKTGVHYKLSIAGKNNLSTFRNQINFSIDYKKLKLYSILGKEGKTNVDLVPNCSRYIKSLRKELGYSQSQFAQHIGCIRHYVSLLERGKRFPSKRVFNEIIKLDKFKPDLKHLLELNYRKIVKIKKKESFNGFVYDISVRDNENFSAGFGNVIVHNTFTIANLIKKIQKPTLIMAPNKTLAAQLYNELKELFPNNAVHYFVSYYDYYQPEAYMPITGLYIEKDFNVNEEIERLRLAAAHAVRTRKDVIIVATVSCIYGLGNPELWENIALNVEQGDNIERSEILKKLIKMQYERNDIEFKPGTVRVKGDIVDIYPSYLNNAVRISLFGDEIESITEIHPLTNDPIKKVPNYKIFPATHFIIPEENKLKALELIEEELEEQIAYFKKEKKYAEAQRLEKRIKFDLEMMREMGWCKGIENYSRSLDGRPAGTPPMTLVDYFPEDYLIVVDESHVTVPQIHGMIGGDRSRKKNLVDFGWRLPSAYDNRPLTFEEWESKIKYIVFMSATPGNYELKKSRGISAEQIIRPTGLVDPVVEVKPAENQIDDLLDEIRKVIKNNGRILVTTLTKRMAEDIAEYYNEIGLKITYLHSEVDTVERFEILRQLRDGTFDVLVGINLLREGLDLPEVQLVAILDADKLGFLRDTRSLIQTIGRASRNIYGRAILYGDKLSRAMKEAIEETNRRRNKQIQFNKENNITPKTIQKNILESLSEEKEYIEKQNKKLRKTVEEKMEELGDFEIQIQYLEEKMFQAAKELRFEDAAYLRDKIKELQLNSRP